MTRDDDRGAARTPPPPTNEATASVGREEFDELRSAVEALQHDFVFGEPPAYWKAKYAEEARAHFQDLVRGLASEVKESGDATQDTLGKLTETICKSSSEAQQKAEKLHADVQCLLKSEDLFRDFETKTREDLGTLKVSLARVETSIEANASRLDALDNKTDKITNDVTDLAKEVTGLGKDVSGIKSAQTILLWGLPPAFLLVLGTVFYVGNGITKDVEKALAKLDAHQGEKHAETTMSPSTKPTQGASVAPAVLEVPIDQDADDEPREIMTPTVSEATRMPLNQASQEMP